MDPFTIINVIEACYKYGNWIVDFVQAWKDADEEVADRAHKVEHVWIRMREQAEFLARVEPTMKPDVRHDFQQSMRILERKLGTAAANIRSVQEGDSAESESGPGRLMGFRRRSKRAKFAWQKEILDEIIADLDDWKERFDPSWYLIMLNASPRVDEELRKAGLAKAGKSGSSGRPQPAGRSPSWDTPSPLALAGGIREAVRPRESNNQSVFLPEREMQNYNIPYSSARLAKTQSSRGESWLILVKVTFEQTQSKADKTEDVRDLARRLKNANPFAFGLFKCIGAIRVYQKSPDMREKWLTGIDMVFDVPKNTDARQYHSLRELLVKSATPGSEMTLTRRVQIAKELTTSVNYVHTFDFVHKNICPESVLVLDQGDTIASRRKRSTFLVGFECFRSSDGGTVLMADESWERNVYRHPERQGINPVEKYKMQHDIYSLGVCLLEIGLGESLLEFPNAQGPLRPQFGRIVKEFVDDFTKKTGQQITNPTRFSTLGRHFKDFLVMYSETVLPRKMGERYAQVVVTCLTCLDSDNDGFGDLAEGEDDDDDGEEIGMRFIKRILGKLNEIKL